MDREVDWIKAALGRNPSKTRSGLAKALGIDKSSVTRLLRGERRLKFSEARQAAVYLGVEPPTGFAEEGAPYSGMDAADAGAETAPIYRGEPGKDGFWRLDRTKIIERRPRGNALKGVASAFGLYVPDDAMSPRFKIGEIAWINPARPAGPGDDALLVESVDGGGDAAILLCEVASIADGVIIARQHKNDATYEFDLGVGRGMYVLPRS